MTPRPATHPGRLMACAIVLGSLSACAGIRLGPATTPDPSVVEFCAEFVSAGGDSATVGPLDLSLPAQLLSTELRGKLAAMGQLEPPATIVDAWSAYKDYFTAVQLALADQPDDAVLDDNDLVQRGLELYPQSRVVRNFYLTSCAR